LADDISAQLASSNDSEALTGAYLGELAARHSMKLATLDRQMAHPASELIQ
jgi:hypothetical protein